MKPFIFKKLVAFIIILIVFSRCAPSLIDISPDRPNGDLNGGNSTAGLVINMAGDKDGLYAIGLNSGVWKTQLKPDGTFNSWKQLPQSPRYAHCIAVDPGAPEHIAVGERAGDAKDINNNNTGLWESYDGGKTFDKKNYYDLLTHACGNHVVNAVVITNQSTTLISTPCGIGRKEYFEKSFSYPDNVSTQNFTSIATFKDWIVARTKTEIFLSNNDGKSWDKGHTIKLSFPAENFTQDYIGDQGGNYSVCIVQEPQTNNVFVYVPVTRANNVPNEGSCVIFDNQNKTWTFQDIPQAGLGIVNGGRVFMKSFLLNNPNLQNMMGGSTNLIYCASDDVIKATQINSDGTAVWESVAKVPGKSNFHTDGWDYLIDPSGRYAWVSCDGGVYYYPMDTKQTTLGLNAENIYAHLNEGLHTQHIHQAFIAGYLGNRPGGHEHYGYGSQDNGGWKNVPSFLTNAPDWSNIEGTTDVNIIEGDQGNADFILVARNLQSARLAGLQSIGTLAPAGAQLDTAAIAYNGSSFQFIQTLALESPPPLLDAVMLTTLPLQYIKDRSQYIIDQKLTNVPGDAGQKSGLSIIRNTAFASSPDINRSLGSGWSVEFNDLPSGPQAFWVSGGHVNPTYFLLCNQSGNTIIYRRKKSESSWSALNMPSGVQIIPYLVGVVQHGPLFVNPYNPSELYVSCTKGIYHGDIRFTGLHETGWVFSKDIDLTNLVSGSGKYDISKTFPGGDGRNVAHANQSNLNAMYPLSWLSFNRYHFNQVVASSPFTGVFFKDGAKNWKDLSGVLPKPFTPVSSVNINNQGIYITTEGRGMFKIVNY